MNNDEVQRDAEGWAGDELGYNLDGQSSRKINRSRIKPHKARLGQASWVMLTGKKDGHVHASHILAQSVELNSPKI